MNTQILSMGFIAHLTILGSTLNVRAFFSCMAWRAIPGPLSKRKRRLDSLEAAQGAPRDPRRDSRGERSPWLPLETRPDSPGKKERTNSWGLFFVLNSLQLSL